MFVVSSLISTFETPELSQTRMES